MLAHAGSSEVIADVTVPIANLLWIRRPRATALALATLQWR
jgi:hypothetical protein